MNGEKPTVSLHPNPQKALRGKWVKQQGHLVKRYDFIFKISSVLGDPPVQTKWGEINFVDKRSSKTWEGGGVPLKNRLKELLPPYSCPPSLES